MNPSSSSSSIPIRSTPPASSRSSAAASQATSPSLNNNLLNSILQATSPDTSSSSVPSQQQPSRTSKLIEKSKTALNSMLNRQPSLDDELLGPAQPKPTNADLSSFYSTSPVQHGNLTPREPMRSENTYRPPVRQTGFAAPPTHRPPPPSHRPPAPGTQSGSNHNTPTATAAIPTSMPPTLRDMHSQPHQAQAQQQQSRPQQQQQQQSQPDLLTFDAPTATTAAQPTKSPQDDFLTDLINSTTVPAPVPVTAPTPTPAPAPTVIAAPAAPVVVNEPPLAAAVASDSTSPVVDPAPSDPAPASDAAPAPLSPKTSKLLRRIQRREQELEELQYENELLREANRRANEERSVREQEKRMEQKKRAEIDAAKDREIAQLKEQLNALHEQGALHDPAVCSRTIGELTELLELREEQLDLINRDRSKLYEEVEIWKIGMEKLASLQANTQQQHGSGSATPSINMEAAMMAEMQRQQEIAAAAAVSNQTPSSSSSLLSPPAASHSRALSDMKEDSGDDLRMSNSGILAPVASMVVDTTATAASSPGTPFTPATPSSTTSKAPGTSTPPSTSTDAVVEEIWQNEHRHPFYGWQPTNYAFMRYPFSDETGSIAKTFESTTLPPGFVWENQWHVDKSEWHDEHAGDEGRSTKRHQETSTLTKLRASIGLGGKASESGTPSERTSGASTPSPSSNTVGTDPEGWRYSIQYKLFAWHSECGRLDTVRRRRWKRRRVYVGLAATTAMLQNALAAIEATRAPVAGTTHVAGKTVSNEPDLASLAAAYSNGSSTDAFSMFTSVAPPGIGVQHGDGSAKALALLLQLGTRSTGTSHTASATATNAPTSPKQGEELQQEQKPLDDALLATTPTAAPASIFNPYNAVGAIVGLPSYLASTRVISFFGRRGTTEATTPTSATKQTEMNEITPASNIPPSSVCSCCSSPSRTALQYVAVTTTDANSASPVSILDMASATSSAPSSTHTEPLGAYCLPHYHQLSKHLVAGLEANEQYAAAASAQAGTARQSNQCEMCDSTDTQPVQVLHLANSSTPSTPNASSRSVASTSTTTASVDVLDAHDTFRFCSAHMPQFLSIMHSFQPTEPTTTIVEALAEDEAEVADVLAADATGSETTRKQHKPRLRASQ